MLIEGDSAYPGFPSQQDSYVPGINTTYDDSMQAPPLTTAQQAWDAVKNFGSGIWEISGQVGHSIVQGVEQGYDALDSSVKRVSKDISGTTETLLQPVGQVVGTATFTIVIVVAALGIALYYTGKSGGLRLSI